MEVSVEKMIELAKHGLEFYDVLSEKRNPLKKAKIHYRRFYDGSLSFWVANDSEHDIAVRFCGVRGNDIDTGKQYILDPNSNSDDYDYRRRLHLAPAHAASKEIIYSAKELDNIISNRYYAKLHESHTDSEILRPDTNQIASEFKLNDHIYYIDVAFQDASNRLIEKNKIPVMDLGYTN